MVEIFLPEIDCDADTGVTGNPGFWEVMYTIKSCAKIISDVLKPSSPVSAVMDGWIFFQNDPGMV